MNTDRTIDTLLEQGILAKTGDEDSISIDGGFRERVDCLLDEEESIADDVALGDLADLEGDRSSDLASHSQGVPRELLAIHRILDERVDDLEDREKLYAALLVLQIRFGRTRTSGAPPMFFPVSGSLLSTFVGFYRKAVVYVWREDCEPCDIVREDLEAVTGDGIEDVALLAVYGPDFPEQLEAEYNVVGAPTTLFFLEGEVDSRVIGAPPRMVLETEVETIREL